MSKRRQVTITIWVVICLAATFFIWRIVNDDSVDGANTSGGVVEQPSGAPPSPAPSSAISPSAPTENPNDESFKKRVLAYYEIATTEDRDRRNELLPAIATEHYIESYRGNESLDNPSVQAVIDASKSQIFYESSHDSNDVNFVIATVHVIKSDRKTGEKVEYTIANDHTSWVKVDGKWMVDSQTVFVQPSQ